MWLRSFSIFPIGLFLILFYSLTSLSADFNYFYGFNRVSLYFLEEKLLHNNPLLKDKETEIKILEESLENFKGENRGDVTVGLSYFPSSYYAEKIMGYTYGVSGRWRYPLMGQFGDIKYKESQLKALISVKKAELEKLKLSLLYKLRSAYIDYYYSFLVESKLKSAIFELQDIESRLKQRYSKKFSLWTDVLTVDTLITKLRASLATVYEDRLKSLARIRSLVADPFLPEFYPQLDYDSRLTNLYLPPANELVEFAKEHRKDVAYIKKAYSLLSRASEEYGDTYPKAWISVIGAVTSYDMDTVNSGMGITLDFTFPWRKKEAEKALRNERLLRAKRELIRASLSETDLITAVQNAVSNFEIYRNKYLAFKKEFESVKQSRKVFEERLKAGLYSGGDGLIRLASIVNQEIGSYQLMMLSFKNMLVQYFSLLEAMGVRELPWIVRSASPSFISSSLPPSPPVNVQLPSIKLLLFAYVWNTEDFLGNPTLEVEFVRNCRALGLNGIYLSLNGEQIKEFLGEFSGNQKLMKFISLAKSQGLTVQLLLGENTWIFPPNRKKLINIIKLFNRFNSMAGSYGFDGLHLDIEPHALPDWKFEKTRLETLYVETLSEVKKISDKPVIVDIPPYFVNLDFQGTTLADEVFSLVDGVNVMAYSTSIPYLRKVASFYSSLSSKYGKPITVSLSVEKDLSDMETFYRKPISELLKALKNIENSGVSSVAFQDFSSLVNYLKGQSLKPSVFKGEKPQFPESENLPQKPLRKRNRNIKPDLQPSSSLKVNNEKKEVVHHRNMAFPVTPHSSKLGLELFFTETSTIPREIVVMR